MEIKIEYPVYADGIYKEFINDANGVRLFQISDSVSNYEAVADELVAAINAAHNNETRQTTQSCPVCVDNEPVIRGMREALEPFLKYAERVETVWGPNALDHPAIKEQWRGSGHAEAEPLLKDYLTLRKAALAAAGGAGV